MLKFEIEKKPNQYCLANTIINPHKIENYLIDILLSFKKFNIALSIDRKYKQLFAYHYTNVNTNYFFMGIKTVKI